MEGVKKKKKTEKRKMTKNRGRKARKGKWENGTGAEKRPGKVKLNPPLAASPATRKFGAGVRAGHCRRPPRALQISPTPPLLNYAATHKLRPNTINCGGKPDRSLGMKGGKGRRDREWERGREGKCEREIKESESGSNDLGNEKGGIEREKRGQWEERKEGTEVRENKRR